LQASRLHWEQFLSLSETGTLVCFLFLHLFHGLCLCKYSAFQLIIEPFFKTLPILLGYGVLVAFLLMRFGFENLFLWYLILSILFLLINLKKQREFKNFLEMLSDGDKDKEKELEISFNKTIKYRILSSLAFLTSFVLAFYYL
jgi:phosphatidylserine synthase